MLTTATTTPERRLSNWEAELAAGYLSASGARPPPPADLLGVVAGEWPELAQSAASRGLSLDLFGLSREAPSLGGAHGTIFSVYASWSQGPSFETQRCFLWLGPAGLVRLSGRPEALSAALAAGPWRPERAPADELAELIANTLVLYDRPDRGDDPWGVRQGRMRSAVLTKYALDRLDSGGSFAPLEPVSHERWRALRAWLVPPQLLPERDKNGHCLVFWLIKSVDTPTPGGKAVLFRVSRHCWFISDIDCSLLHRDEELARDWFATPHLPIVGRPLLIGGAPRQAPLARGGAWCGDDE